MFARSSGILMHITSLPGSYGIGTLGEEAYGFIDFLKKSGQKYWQILPVGATGYGDSPYQSFSTHAGNPYLIDLDRLCEDGLIEREHLAALPLPAEEGKADYENVGAHKIHILKEASAKGIEKYSESMDVFYQENQWWLEDYALFMALKAHHNDVSWQAWDEDIKLRKEEALDKYKELLKDELQFWVFVQYTFFEQWRAFKAYANENGIEIIGDIPIYIAVDSVDTWANSDIFDLDEHMNPVTVSGCPPDAFSDTGQLWGNPIYSWDRLEERGYDWWIDRLRNSMTLYDVLRIDHFRGFESYWEIPYGDETAENGEWVKGPGMKLFDKVRKELGELNIIAEDLGFLTEEVLEFVKDSGFPGMKVLQFAFDAREESDYLPHNYDKHCVVYTGTHDNDTARGWFNTAAEADVAYAKAYLKLDEEEGLNWGFIRGAWSSVGNMALAQMQDFLDLDSEARMNIPSTIGGNNWRWRVNKEQLTDELAEKINQMTKLYGR